MFAVLPISVLRDSELSDKDKVVAAEIFHLLPFQNPNKIKQIIYMNHGIHTGFTDRVIQSLVEAGHLEVGSKSLSVPTRQIKVDRNNTKASGAQTKRFADIWERHYGVRPSISLALRNALGARLKSFSMDDIEKAAINRRSQLISKPKQDLNNWNRFIYSDKVIGMFLDVPEIEKNELKKYNFE